MEKLEDPTLLHGLIGLAAVGALSIALLAIVIAGSPPEHLLMASY
jgi:hypothetical protein